MAKTTAELENVNAVDVVVTCCSVFTEGDCYAVMLVRMPRSRYSVDRMREPAFDGAGVQAFDADGAETHADLTPDQHARLYDLAEEAAV